MKKLLLIAKPVSNVIGPKYLISQPNSEKVEAVIRGNLLKNCFSIYDDGFNPKKNLCPKRKELGNIIFEKNSFFSEKPYSIKLIIPRPGDGIEVGMNKLFEVKGIEQRKEGGNELMEMEEKNLREIMVIKSKNPTYNKEKRIYELNFKGYIEEASFINCILNVQSGQ